MTPYCGLLAEGARRVLAASTISRAPPLGACPPWRRNRRRLSRTAGGGWQGDALTIDPLVHLTAPIKIVANLPYNVGTELLIRWLTPRDWPPFWTSLTLMFQKEVAERIVAKPGSKAYGRLALLAQWRCDVRIVLTLPPSAFTPPPKIDSAVVHLTALAEPRYPAPAKTLERVVAAAFNQRRKMLRAALRGLDPQIEARLERLGIAPTARAEELGLEAFCTLARDFG